MLWKMVNWRMHQRRKTAWGDWHSAGFSEKTSGLPSSTSRAGCATWCDNTLMPPGHCLPPPEEICSLTFAISVNTIMSFIFINPGSAAAALLLALWPLRFPLVEDSFIWMLLLPPSLELRVCKAEGLVSLTHSLFFRSRRWSWKVVAVGERAGIRNSPSDIPKPENQRQSMQFAWVGLKHHCCPLNSVSGELSWPQAETRHRKLMIAHCSSGISVLRTLQLHSYSVYFG